MTNATFRPGATLPRAAAGRLVAYLGSGLCAALLSLGAHAQAGPAEAGAKRADFGVEAPSKDARFIADWVVDSGDNHGLPFVIIDKTAAKEYVFKPDGKMRGAAPVLLGIAKGDDSMPGVGDKPLAEIPVEVRTTPAGRFVSGLGMNAHGKSVVWVDYDAAVSMHRVINTNPKERRPHRLETPTPADNRISFGCINVPIKFFDDVIEPTFQGTNGVIYVLPEVHPLRKVFSAAYEVTDKARLAGTAPDAPPPESLTAAPRPSVPVVSPVTRVSHIAHATSRAPSTRTQ